MNCAHPKALFGGEKPFAKIVFSPGGAVVRM